MPRKKKVVNEEINPAPQTQDVSDNIIDNKVEIVKKNKPKKKSNIRQNPLNKTVESPKNDIIVSQIEENKDHSPNNKLNINEQLGEKTVSEEKNDLKVARNHAKSKKIIEQKTNEIAEADKEIAKVEVVIEQIPNEFVEQKITKKKPYKKKKKVTPKVVVQEAIMTQEKENNSFVHVENVPKVEQVDSQSVESKEFVDNIFNKLNIKDEERKLETDNIQKNELQVEAKAEEKIFKKKNKWQKKKKDKTASLQGEIKSDINSLPEVKEITEVIESKVEVIPQNDSKIQQENVNIPAEEISKTEELSDEQTEVKAEERRKNKNKNKKKKKNKKDRIENTTDDKQETKQDIQTVEKKAEPAKIIRKPEPEIIITINPKKMLTKEQEKNPFLIKFFGQLEDFLRKEVQIEKGQKLLVAMSGGVDSSVLFDALSVLSFKMKFIIYVLHFNHKLRGLSSERDEKLVNQLSKEYNVQYFNASGNVKQFAERNSLSIEYAARQLRYNFFEKVARTMNANFVATAHTADDNVETFFLNLFRGSGLTGLSGIPAKRNLVKNVMMLRPLITFRKKELLEYAKIRRLKWFEDETNSLLNYTRNKIRLSLIPRLEEEFNPSITDIINQTTKLMSGADRLIRDIVKKNYPLVVEDASQEKFTIKLPMLMANEEFIQGEIIQYLWLKYFRLQPLPMQTINRILNLHHSQTGAICEINSMYFVLKDRNNLIFTKRQYEENIKLLVSVPGKYFIGRYKIELTEVDRSEVVFEDNPNIEYFDSSIQNSFLEIRNWQMGDTFQPLGMKGEMKVSDFLINEKVPITEKASVIVLTNKTDIIWIVGKRISDKFKIKNNSEKVIKAVIIKNEKK